MVPPRFIFTQKMIDQAQAGYKQYAQLKFVFGQYFMKQDFPKWTIIT